MAKRRFFSRETPQGLELVEFGWSSRAFEILRGLAGTVGALEERKFPDPESVTRVINQNADGLLAEGFVEDKKPRGAIDALSYWSAKVQHDYMKHAAQPEFGKRGGLSMPTASRIGGLPAISAKGWPKCGRCGKHLKFVLQIQSKELASPQFSGILQIFLCDSDCYYEDGWEPFSPISCVRIVPGHSEANELAPPIADEDGDFLEPATPIARWEEVEVAPDIDTLVEMLGLDRDIAVEIEEYFADDGHVRGGEQIGGWPDWIQAPQSPDCKKCGTKGMIGLMNSDRAVDGFEVLSGMRIFVLRCQQCLELTTVMQR